MRFAYADPPYLGYCCRYDHYHPDGLCWDDLTTHKLLIGRLVDEYPDGWALSAISPSLREILPICPEDARVGAWVKPFCSFKPHVRPAYAWEPVIFWRGRNPSAGYPYRREGMKRGKLTTPRDFVSANMTLKKGLTGAKPEPVCQWILDFLGWVPGDEVDDLYPGTGIMGRVVASRSEEAA